MWALLHSAAFLADGRVLALWDDLAGDAYPSRSSLYDPETDTRTDLAPPWDYQRWPGVLSVVGLPDGSALAVLTGSLDGVSTTTQSSLFDPVAGVWLEPVDIPISAGNGVLLDDGRVLLFGVSVASTYLYDPATGSWDAGPTLPFDDPTAAAVLDEGSVIALSAHGRSARLPPGGATWLRSGTAAVGDNAVLIATPGGAFALGGTSWHKGAIHVGPDPRTAVYRADTHRWSSGPDTPPLWDAVAPTGPGYWPAEVLLPDGRVLAAGGWGGGTDYDCGEGAAILSADALAWQSIEPMPACLAGRAIGQARADGSVVIVGEGQSYVDGDFGGIGILLLSYQP